MVKVIIFDAICVLVSDGAQLSAEKVSNEMHLKGADEFFEKNSFWDKNWIRFWKGEIDEAGMIKGMTPEIGEDNAKRFFRYWRELAVIDPKMMSLAHKLKKDGFAIGLLTNSPPMMCQYLEDNMPAGLFDTVVASCAVRIMKPDIDMYELIIKEMGVEPDECLFIDDNKNNTIVGSKIGMQTIHFTGYDDLIKDLEEMKILPV